MDMMVTFLFQDIWGMSALLGNLSVERGVKVPEQIPQSFRMNHH